MVVISFSNCLLWISTIITPKSKTGERDDVQRMLKEDPGNKYYQEFPQHTVNFYPRFGMQAAFVPEDKVENSRALFNSSQIEDTSSLVPSKTEKEHLKPRATFSALCPTSIECPDQGCCAFGTYCTTVNGIAGCCDLPLGKQCLANGWNCNIPCDDHCCDNFKGPDRLGNTYGSIYCSQINTGLSGEWDDATPRYECLFGIAPPEDPPICALVNEFACGEECCVSGEICNSDIPGFSFCELASHEKVPGNTAVSELGFGARLYNTASGAHQPTGGVAVLKGTQAIKAANGTSTPTPTIFVGQPGAGGGATATTSASTTTSTSRSAACQRSLASYTLLIWSFLGAWIIS